MPLLPTAASVLLLAEDAVAPVDDDVATIATPVVLGSGVVSLHLSAVLSSRKDVLGLSVVAADGPAAASAAGAVAPPPPLVAWCWTE